MSSEFLRFLCTALQSANQESQVGKGKHAYACVLPGIKRCFKERPWNGISLRDSRDGMALPMGFQVQGWSGIRHASHHLEGCIGGRDMFSKLDHTEVTNTSLCPKGAALPLSHSWHIQIDAHDINHFIFVSPIPYTQPRTFPVVKALTTMVPSATISTTARNRRDRLAPPQRHSAHRPPQ